MHRLASEGPPDYPAPSASEIAAAEAVVLGEAWQWPPRRDNSGVAGPEPTRDAFRRYLEGGPNYFTDHP